MRALVVTNMYPTPADPGRGSFVRDQVEALRRLPDLEVELCAFGAGGLSPYPRAARALRRRYRPGSVDIVHAHFGLTAWSALAVRGAAHAVTLHGTDLVVPRSRALTLAALPWLDLVAPVSDALAELIPRRLVRGRCETLPCGVALDRFRPMPRAEARAVLGLPLAERLLLFPADPSRPEKRVDRARAVADGRRLLTLGHVAPERMPLWINAADAVLVTSERESFGLAVLEALACEVPVLATPVGVHADALLGLTDALCAPYDALVWRRALDGILADPDPRTAGGRAAATPFSADAMAARVARAWRATLAAR